MTQRVAVVGAGMVGLSTAWFLQEHGFHVTVYDRDHVAAGSSWGNAGWLTPALTAPLPEPAVLRYGVRAVVSPPSPVYVPPRAHPRLFRLLACFRTPAERAVLVEELEHLQAAGQDVKYDLMTGHEARAAEPALSSSIAA